MNKPIIFILTLFAIITGCKKNDEQGVTLLGKWYKQYVYDGNGWDATIQEGYSKQDYYIFNQDNTLTSSYGYSNTNGTVAVNKSTFSYTHIQHDAKPSQVAIQFNERKYTYNIEKLTRDSLYLSKRDTTYVQGVQYKGYYLLKLSRK